MADIVAAQTIRVATYNASLSRNGAGLLLRAIEKGTDAQIRSVISVIAHVEPDILLINEFDHDLEERAVGAFANALAKSGIIYPHYFTSVPNTGMPSGFDLDNDGSASGPGDAFGYGTFPGQYGMLLLSKFPLVTEDIREFSRLLWRDMPEANLPKFEDGSPYPSNDAQQAMRLSSKSHWDVPTDTPIGRLHILASHPTPPVFDGPEDRNGLRNADEIRFWSHYLDGVSFEDDDGKSLRFTQDEFVLLGDLNADPNDGDGVRNAIKSLLEHPKLQDPRPSSKGAREAALDGVNTAHRGDPSLDTADWRDTSGPGNLRVDYALPSRGLTVVDAGVFWPAPGEDAHALLGQGKSRASDHHLVWVDLTRR